VFRTLYNEHYKRGRGFTSEDMIAIINRLTKKDYHEFFRQYVFWTDVPDYDRIFGYAGYKLEKIKGQVIDLGFSGRFRSGGLVVNGIVPNSGAAAGGLKVGDTISKIDGRPVIGFPIDSLAGKTATVTVIRSGSETEIPIKFGSREVTNYRLVEVANPTPQQLKIRAGWLKR
jgi:predicted metalloprotease with PDZ domain